MKDANPVRQGAVVVCLLIAAVVVTAESADGDVIQASVAARAKIAAIDAKRRKATSQLHRQLRELSQRRARLEGEPLDETQLNLRRARLQQLEQEVAALKREIADAQVKDRKQRDRMAAEVKVEAETLRQNKLRLDQPYVKQMTALRHDVEGNNKELAQAMSSYFLVPTAGPFKDVKDTKIKAQFAEAFASCSWYAGKKQIAWAHVMIRKPIVPLPKDLPKVADAYSILQHNKSEILLWAGDCQISFSIVDPKRQGKDKIQAAVQQFLDLQKLAKIEIPE